jgi:hypothetical protein
MEDEKWVLFLGLLRKEECMAQKNEKDQYIFQLDMKFSRAPLFIYVGRIIDVLRILKELMRSDRSYAELYADLITLETFAKDIKGRGVLHWHRADTLQHETRGKKGEKIISLLSWIQRAYINKDNFNILDSCATYFSIFFL